MDTPPVGYEAAHRSAWLERDDPEWPRAWSHFADPVLAHPESGEVLQYMGSTEEPARGGWVHVFRHRHMPTSQQRQYWRIPATAGWTPQRSPQGWDDDRREETTRQMRRTMMRE